jgi:hypothetical protein
MAIRKKKMNYTPLLIGLGAAGVIGYLFRKEIKGFIMPEPEPEPEPTPTPNPVINNVITNGGVISTPVGITKGLSGLGTPKDRLNLNQTLKQGDKGQEVVKLQQILNRIAKITRKPLVTEDGDFGQGTLTRLTDLFSSGQTNLFKAYAALFAIYNANKNGDLKNWFKKYYEPYLTDKTRYGNARSFYFANNEIL